MGSNGYRRRPEMVQSRRLYAAQLLRMEGVSQACPPAGVEESINIFAEKAKAANRSLAVVDSVRWLKQLKTEENWAVIVESKENVQESEWVLTVGSIQYACPLIENPLVAVGSQRLIDETGHPKLWRVAKRIWCQRAFVVTDDQAASLVNVDAIVRAPNEIETPWGFMDENATLLSALQEYQVLNQRLKSLVPMTSSSAVDKLGPERVFDDQDGRVNAYLKHLYDIDDGGDSGLDQRRAAGVDFEEILPNEYKAIPSWQRGSALRGGCEIWRRKQHSSVSILLLHGGANICYSPRAYRPLASRLAAATGFNVVVPDYRLAPEHKYPCALDDAESVFNDLANDPKIKHIILLGDSSGGALVLSLAMFRLASKVHHKVRGIVALSPWLDMAARTDSYSMTHDPVYNSGDSEVERLDTQNLAKHYFSSISHFDADVHPLYARPHQYSTLPPLYLVLGDGEVLRDDGLIFALRAEDHSQSEVSLDLWPRLWHVFTMYSEGMRLLKDDQGNCLPFNEANVALRRISRWMHSTIQQIDEEEVRQSPLSLIPMTYPPLDGVDIDVDGVPAMMPSVPLVPLLDTDEPRPENSDLYY